MLGNGYTELEWSALAADWLPRIIGAVAVMIAAWLLGWAAKWGITRLVDRVPGVRRHNERVPADQSLGAQLGALANWIILLVGLINALAVLGLDYIIAPLNGLVNSLFGFGVNVVGAALIFVVGYVLATLARRVVEAGLNVAGVDRTLERAGLARLTGASGLAKTAGAVVFVLILIPVAIAALEQLGIRAISEPAVSVLETVLNAVPRVLAAAIVLAVAYLIARWVASLIEQLLPSLGFDRTLTSLGLFRSSGSAPSAAPQPTTSESVDAPAGETAFSTLSQDGSVAQAPTSGLTPSRIVAQIALWAVMLFVSTEAARLLGFDSIALMLQEILQLFGRVLFGGVIITAGVLIANFLAGLVGRAGGREGFASTIVRWATIALATAMGLRFMGIADEIVILAFGLILGSAAVAAAIAFGIGGREPARRLLEEVRERARRDGPPPPDAPLVG